MHSAEDVGFKQDGAIDLPQPAQSRCPTDFGRNLPALAQAAIGQNDVAATPLQMAMVSAAVANQGKVMAPHVLDHVRDTDGNVVDTFEPEVWTTAMDARAAAIMRGAMLGVVTDRTASRLPIPGFEVGGERKRGGEGKSVYVRVDFGGRR